MEGYQTTYKECFKKKKIGLSHLVSLLNTIEGWGDQQIYLYGQVQRSRCKELQDIDSFSEILKKHNVLPLLNAETSTVMPDARSIVTIQHSKERLRIIWVERREWDSRRSSLDKRKGNLTYRAYEGHEQRGIVSYDLNFKDALSMLMIQKIPGSTNAAYQKLRAEIEKEIEEIFSIKSLKSIELRKAISKIEKSKEARTRQIEDETVRKSKAKYTSANRKTAVDKDKTVTKARNAMAADSLPSMGNFYWVPTKKGEIKHDLHSLLYAKDNRMGIYGERTEEEVRYVVGRVRYFAQ